ncbi:hypothetical protein [Paenibacillus lautus]
MVAARPFEGKTAFALNVTQKVAKSTHEAVALSSQRCQKVSSHNGW